MYDDGFNLLQQKNFAEALAYFESYLKRNFPRPERSEKLLYGKARALIGLKQYSTAFNILNDLIQKHPTWISLYLTLARMLEELQFFALAESMYKKALKLSPDDQKTKAEEHYHFFLHTYVKENEYIQPSRVYIPGYIDVQERVAPNEEEILAKGIEWFEQSSLCPSRYRTPG